MACGSRCFPAQGSEGKPRFKLLTVGKSTPKQMKKGSNRDSSRIGSEQPVLCSTSKWKSLLISVVTACIAPRHLKRKPKAEPKHQRCFWEKNRDAEPQNLPLTLLLWPCSARFHHSRALFVKQKIRTLFGCSCALLFGPSVLSIFMSTCFQAASK